MRKEKTPQEWEIDIKERFARIDERGLLDQAQYLAVTLASHLCDAHVMARTVKTMPEEMWNFLRERIGQMAVMLDVLQLRYGDCADEEMLYLETLEEVLKKE